MVTSQEIEAQTCPVLKEIETTGFLLNTEALEKRIPYFTEHKRQLRQQAIRLLDKMELTPLIAVDRGRYRGKCLLDLGMDLMNFDDDGEVIAALNRIPGVTVNSRSKLTLQALAERTPIAAPVCKVLMEMNHCDGMIDNYGKSWMEKAQNGYL